MSNEEKLTKAGINWLACNMPTNYILIEEVRL